MSNPEAARIADMLRTAMKSQNLNGPALADEIERLTGNRPGPMTVSRWMRGERPLIRVSPELDVIARALKLDPVELACDAIRQTQLEPDTQPTTLDIEIGMVVRSAEAMAGSRNATYREVAGITTPAGYDGRSIAYTDGSRDLYPLGHKFEIAGTADRPNPYQSPRCTHPNRAGEGCPACCDTCNADGHGCRRCGTPVGHRTRTCTDCPDEDDE